MTRRFLYKASGQKEKFSVKAEKEEKEYFDALRAEKKAQDEQGKLDRQMTEARQGKAQLEPEAAKHKQAQKDLDSLYHSIFAGDTPAFPEEDVSLLNPSSSFSSTGRRFSGLVARSILESMLTRLSGARERYARCP